MLPDTFLMRKMEKMGTVLEMRVKAEHQPTREKEYRIVTSNSLKILKKISWREAQKLA